MTEQEIKQEEIRLLNLKVDELKAQNSHYKVESDELESKKEVFLAEMARIEKEHGDMVELEKDMQSKIASLQKSTTEFEKALSIIKEEISSEDKRLSVIRAENIREETKKEELRHALNELEQKLSIGQSEFAAKYDSLKSFEEQLLIKEALLNRREQSLDLKEQGVKI
jgi:chromosome segregation ATPase